MQLSLFETRKDTQKLYADQYFAWAEYKGKSSKSIIRFLMVTSCILTQLDRRELC